MLTIFISPPFIYALYCIPFPTHLGMPIILPTLPSRLTLYHGFCNRMFLLLEINRRTLTILYIPISPCLTRMHSPVVYYLSDATPSPA